MLYPADAGTALVGGANDYNGAGAVWVFVSSPVVPNGPTILTGGTGVINSGSYLRGNVVSGSWVAVKGTGFTDKTIDWSNQDFSKGLLPTTLQGVHVLFNGQPGAIWYLIGGSLVQRINVQAPANVSGNITVQVVRNGVAGNIVTTTATSVAPGIFAFSLDTGITSYPSAVFFPDVAVRLGDPATFPGARKANAGDIIIMFANSLAPSTAGVVTVSGTTHPVTIKIGSTTIPADAFNLIAPGEFQIAFTVPSLGASDNYPFTLIIDGVSSETGVFLPYTN